MKRSLCLSLFLTGCRCGEIQTVVVSDPQESEAGVVVDLPEAVKPTIPRLDRLVKDEASIERNMIQLKGLGLGYLVDAGAAP